MTHAPTILRFPIPPGIRTAKDAEPAARDLAELMAAHSLSSADDLLTLALVNVCLAASAGDAEVVLRAPERNVQ